MKIGFIGSGRVATHLAFKLHQQHQVVQIYSQNYDHAEKLALHMQADAIHDLNEFNQDLDVLIISVSDQAIETVAQQLAQLNFRGLIVHTSGSTHLNILSEYLNRVGVFYPLQTFSFDCAVDWNNTPLFVEANSESDIYLLTDLAGEISSKVYQYSSEQRLSLHLAAVFACNFSNYCYDMAKHIVDEQQVDFALLYPLILATAKKATQIDPKHAQTGPAMRSDDKILEMHQYMLKKSKSTELSHIYEMLSDGIKKRQHNF